MPSLRLNDWEFCSPKALGTTDSALGCTQHDPIALWSSPLDDSTVGYAVLSSNGTLLGRGNLTKTCF